MDQATKKAFFVNVVLVANADGTVDPHEERFIRDFVERAGITEEETRHWLDELRAGRVGFQPIDDQAAARQALKLMVGAASSNASLDASQKRALVDWAKVMGVGFEELKETVRANWGADVLTDLFPLFPSRSPIAASSSGQPPAASPSPATGASATPVLAISDGFERLERFREVSPEVDIEVRSLDDVAARGREPAFVVFHAAEDRAMSLRTLRRLGHAVPGARILCVLHRHQAYQVSYLLEAGAHGCMVEPIYPGELERKLKQERRRPAS